MSMLPKSRNLNQTMASEYWEVLRLSSETHDAHPRVKQGPRRFGGFIRTGRVFNPCWAPRERSSSSERERARK
jgi:hypothetical protein